jgi:farnesyl diphosphate synthase
MRHAAMGGGKRLRPLLVAASAELLGVPRERALRAGLAAECIHVQSLIHDDLPCMDDDDLRRGRPTVHCAYDEATAVLAGDALLSLAFGILAETDVHPDGEVRCELVRSLAAASGAGGMAGGQMMDLMPAEQADPLIVAKVQSLKTGALIEWCAEAGPILAGADGEERRRLKRYGACLGLAFQIADDLLDAEGDEAAAGKRLRKDADKPSFVSILGVEAAHQEAERLVGEAADCLASYGARAGLLNAIARFAVTRSC